MKIHLAALLFAVSPIVANQSPLELPEAPPFSAIEAARLGDEYVASRFPQFPMLYCSDVAYVSDPKPDGSVIWRLRYFIPNNPAKIVPGSLPDFGVCLVFVHKDRTVTHTTEPKQNPRK